VERDFEVAMPVPGEVQAPGPAGARIRLELIESQLPSAGPPIAHDKLEQDLDWNRIQFLAVVEGTPGESSPILRNWRPGDAYRRTGDHHEHKLKALFHEARIPLWERRTWPVVTVAGRIVWTRRFGAAQEFAADSSSRLVLRITDSITGS
jgi:tRNA(Ile)-lysidine synthetase-like protein